MDNNHKKALQKNHKVLCDTLELDADLEANLVHYGLFSEAKLDEIKAKRSNKQRIQRLLKALQHRGPDAFDKFLICIHEHYSWLEEKLRRSYQQEVNNTAPSSADLAQERKVQLLVEQTFGKRKQFCQDDKQKISKFLLLHLRQQPRPDSDGTHSENPEQEILRKVFFMLTNDETNGDSTDPLSVPEEVSLDMVAKEISRMSEQLRNLKMQLDHYKTLEVGNTTEALHEQLRNLKMQLDYYKSLEVGDTTKSLHEIVSSAAANKLKLEASQEELAQLQELLTHRDSTIKVNNKRIDDLNSELEKLKMECKNLMQKTYPTDLSKNVRPTNFQRVAQQRSDILHENVQDKDNISRFPRLRNQTNISQPKKQCKSTSESFGNGIGLSASNANSPWRYSLKASRK